jgi:CheY-like chemotaxis protein
VSVRVLIVDDDADLRDVLGEVLAIQGWDVRSAPTAYAALEAIGERRPDVILLDQAMPELHGPAFLRILRGAPGAGDIPVVIISGATASPATLALANGYLQKPFDIDEVVALVRRVAAAGVDEAV